MAQADQTLGVCLYKLDAREEAVLKRVVTFSGAQGRHYALAELAAAQLVVLSNDTTVDLAALNPQGAMVIRIADQESDQPYDLMMQRPLLVTRVMRTLDEARKLWVDNHTETVAPKPAEPVHLTVLTSVADSVIQAEPPEVASTQALVPAHATVQAELQPTEPAPAQMLEPASTTELKAESVAQQTIDADSKPEPKLEVEALAPPAEAVAVSSAELVNPPIEVAPPNLETPVEREGDYHHRALVVDDSAAIRKQLELELRAAGIASDFAETGEEALEKVAAHSYDLVFLDIIMPGIDGYETCRRIRTRKEMKKTPIIMLSAKTSPLDEVQGVIAGASTYLTKPVKSEQLQKTLKRVAMWLDNFQQARS